MSLADYDFDSVVASWRGRGKCWIERVDDDLFFPDLKFGKERMMLERQAKAVCRGCEVQSLCLEWATRQGFEFGVFGGMTYAERKRELRRRHRERVFT